MPRRTFNPISVVDVEPYASQRLEAAWSALLLQWQRPSFFSSVEWFKCCLERMANAANVHALVFYEGQTPIGIVPIQHQINRWRGFPISLATTLHNEDAPHPSVVLRPDKAHLIVRALLHHVSTHHVWQALVLPRIEALSPADVTLRAEMPLSRTLRISAGVNPTVECGTGWETFWNTRSDHFRRILQQKLRRIDRRGSFLVEDMAAVAGPTQCMALFESVAARSWKADLSSSPISNPDVARFFRALTETLHKTQRLLLWVLRLDGRPIATQYHILDGKTIYAVRRDFDEEYQGVSPGSVLDYHIMRHYFRRKLEIFDFGPGDRPFKRQWATSERAFHSYWTFNSSPYPRLLCSFERRVIPVLRRARTWINARKVLPADRGSDILPD